MGTAVDQIRKPNVLRVPVPGFRLQMKASAHHGFRNTLCRTAAEDKMLKHESYSALRPMNDSFPFIHPPVFSNRIGRRLLPAYIPGKFSDTSRITKPADSHDAKSATRILRLHPKT